MSCDLDALNNIDSGDADQLDALMQQCTSSLLSPELWYWAIAFTVIGAIVGAIIGKYKNAVVRDAILGAMLGPIGWIISLLRAPAKKPAACPGCKRPIDAGDAHCRHCGAKLRPAR